MYVIISIGVIVGCSALEFSLGKGGWWVSSTSQDRLKGHWAGWVVMEDGWISTWFYCTYCFGFFILIWGNVPRTLWQREPDSSVAVSIRKPADAADGRRLLALRPAATPPAGAGHAPPAPEHAGVRLRAHPRPHRLLGQQQWGFCCCSVVGDMFTVLHFFYGFLNASWAPVF